MSKTMRSRDARTIQRRLAAVALGFALTASASAAVATDPPQAPQSAGEQAAKFYQEGNQAFTQKRWQEAETAYSKAWAIARTFDVAANLGEVEAHLNKPRQAAELLSYALRSAPPSVKSAQRERTRHFLDEAKTKVHALRLNVSPKEAHVTVDGAPVDPALVGEAMQAGEAHRGGDDVFVDPGEHAVEVALEGYTPQRQPIMALAGTTQMFAFFLKRAPVEVKAPPPPAGSGSSATPPVLPPPPPVKRSPVPAIVLGGVAVGAAAAGIGLLVEGAAKRADARDMNAAILGAHHSCVTGSGNFDPTCPTLNRTALSAGTFHNTGVGLVLGGSAAAVGAAVYLLWPVFRANKANALRVDPMVSSKDAGILFSGSF